MSLVVKKIRKDFPILDSGIIYLDSAATSLTPEPVIQQMLEYYHHYRSNIERGVYEISQKASEEFDKAHRKIANFINAKSSSEIVIVGNTTEGIATVAYGLDWKKGDKIITSFLEHHSNYLLWLRLKKRYGIDIEVIQPDGKGFIQLDDLEKKIDDHTKLVSLTHVSNVLGVILPVNEISKLAHEHGALFLVDGAQSVPSLKVDVKKIGCDFLAFSGHKTCGPTGAGALYIREELLDEIEPLFVGGGPVLEVGSDYFQLEKGGKKFEAGTPPIAEAIGLGVAVDYLKNIGMDKIAQHERKLMETIHKAFMKIPKIKIYGPEPKFKTGIISFNIGELNPYDVALVLNVSENINVRSGHHCALPLMKEVLKTPDGTIRASIYIYNTEEEIERFISAISEIASSLV
ncbi:MAG: cysteine desulfurase [Candidatus Bathyarchaeota archaeon]